MQQWGNRLPSGFFTHPTTKAVALKIVTDSRSRKIPEVRFSSTIVSHGAEPQICGGMAQKQNQSQKKDNIVPNRPASLYHAVL